MTDKNDDIAFKDLPDWNEAKRAQKKAKEYYQTEEFKTLNEYDQARIMLDNASPYFFTREYRELSEEERIRAKMKQARVFYKTEEYNSLPARDRRHIYMRMASEYSKRPSEIRYVYRKRMTGLFFAIFAAFSLLCAYLLQQYLEIPIGITGPILLTLAYGLASIVAIQRDEEKFGK
jgi:hypothetical protein